MANAAAGVRPAYKRRWRNYLLDWRLQLSYVAVVIAISGAIAATLGWLIHGQASYASQRIAERLKGMAWLDEASKAALVSEMTSEDMQLVWVMLAVGIGIALVLGLYMIVMTHRVAGPLFRFGRYFDDMRDGKLPKVWNLRKGDEFAEFFTRFRDANESLRKRGQKEIVLYDRLLAQLETPTASSEPGAAGSGLAGALDRLRLIRARRQRFVGENAPRP